MLSRLIPRSLLHYLLSFCLCIGTMTVFPQSTGHFFSCNVSTEHYSVCTIVAMIIIIIFLWCFPRFQVSFSCLHLFSEYVHHYVAEYYLVVACTILSTGFLSLHRFSLYCFHRFLISAVLSNDFPHLSSTISSLVLKVPQISFTVDKSSLVPYLLVPLSTSRQLPSIHCSLHRFASFLNFLVIVSFSLISLMCAFIASFASKVAQLQRCL